MFITIIQQLLNGIVVGALYALAAVGLGIVFGLFNVINFAHTQYMMIAAVIAIVATWAGAPYGLALIFGVAAAIFAGVLTERVLIKPLFGHDNFRVDTLFLTMGLATLLENSALLLFGSQPQYFSSSMSTGVFEYGELTMPMTGIHVLLISAVIFLLLWIYTTYTRFGKSVVAVAQNSLAAAVVGIRVDLVKSIAFGIGCGLAGIAGVLWGTVYSVSYLTGSTFLITSFLIVVMSGPGNLATILIASLILGIVQSTSVVFFDTKWQQFAVIITFIVAIILFPQGIGAGKFARQNN
ncbi:branched-chain amino acid ABC transporter permease [Castellaniella sp. GW247-6E4]|uniref:branched-chain amino acid ABC transporter permease n=1 Tax=Castellaniella sp. GW247-6E4 TaxID=3140380 RepID=UPI00331615F4